jgi:hypothetical protein
LAGLAADPKSAVSAPESATLSDQAVAALRDAVAAGWTDVTELKEPEFAPLRKRDDFQKLVKDLEATAATGKSSSR